MPSEGPAPDGPTYYYRHGLAVLRGADEAPPWMGFDERMGAWVAPGHRFPDLRAWATPRGVRERSPAWRIDEREPGANPADMPRASSSDPPSASSSGTPSAAPAEERSATTREPTAARAATGAGRADRAAPDGPAPFFDTRRPRPYQRDALDAWLAGEGRGSIVLPTGSGKSLVAILAVRWILHRGEGACIVLPTRALLGQWFNQLADAFGGDRVGAFYGEEKDPRAITVTTYHSAFGLLERFGDRFGLLVLDEVHHLSDTESGEAKAWHDALSIAPAAHRLGLTATYPDGRGRALERLVGPVAYRRRVSEMVDRELADFAVERRFVRLTAGERERYDRATSLYEEFVEDRGYRDRYPDSSDAWRVFMAETRRSPAARRAFRAFRERERIADLSSGKLEEAGRVLRMFPAERAILFCGRADQADALARRFALPLVTAHTAASERRRILESIEEGAVRAVVSVRVLDEGWDVPSAKLGLVLGDTTRGGRRQHRQRLGRILRRQGERVASLFEIVVADTHEFFASQKRGAGVRRMHDGQLGLGL